MLLVFLFRIFHFYFIIRNRDCRFAADGLIRRIKRNNQDRASELRILKHTVRIMPVPSRDCVGILGKRKDRTCLNQKRCHQKQRQQSTQFIRLPGYVGQGDGQISESARLYVGENAFCSSDGSPSPAMELQLSEFVYREFEIRIRSAYVTGRRYVLANTEIYATTEMSDCSVPLWEKNASWYLDDVPAENSHNINVADPGNHTVRVRLNDFVSSHCSFYAVSCRDARKDQLEDYGDEILHGLSNNLISLPLLVIMPVVALSSLGTGIYSCFEGIAGGILSLFAVYIYIQHGLLPASDSTCSVKPGNGQYKP